MKIKWLGHASFLITSDTGTRIITDPYTPGMGMSYGEINESADVVTVSHEHGDHNNVAAIKGKPEVVKNIGSVAVKGIIFNGIASYHDDAGGSVRGNNVIFCFEVDGIKVCHLGDLGHPLSDEQVSALSRVDILLIPVGGGPTIDPTIATEVYNKLAPKIIIPMHYKTDKCSFPPWGADDFIRGKENVIRRDSSEEEFNQAELPVTTQIIVLEPAL
jgi:L-ascorbate metabolism protein UlaG (beta-lactamase superfamily)